MVSQAEQLKFNEFLARQQQGYQSPQEAKQNLVEYYQRALAGESGSVDSRYRAYLEGKLAQLERTPESYEALGQFAGKTGSMPEFLEGIRASGGKFARYQGWTESSGPMPSGAAGGITSVGAGAMLVSPAERRVYYGEREKTRVVQMPDVVQLKQKEEAPQRGGLNWFGNLGQKVSPAQKVLLATGKVPAEYVFGGKRMTVSDYEVQAREFEKQRASFESKVGVFNVQREFYEKAPTEAGYVYLSGKQAPLESEGRVLESRFNVLQGAGAGLAFESLAAKPPTETQTRFYISPEAREQARREVEERQTSLAQGIEKSNARIKEMMYKIPGVQQLYEFGESESKKAEARKEMQPLESLTGSVVGGILKTPVELPQMLGQIGQLQIFSLKGTAREKQVEKQKIMRAPSEIGAYASTKPVSFLVDVGTIAATAYLTGKAFSMPLGAGGKVAGRVATGIKPVRVIQETDVIVSGAREVGAGAKLVSGKIRSTGYADLAFGQKAKIEAGGAFKTLVKPRAETIYAPALPSATGELGLVRTPSAQVGLRSLRESFLPSEAPLTTRQPFLQNVRATSGASGAVKTSVLKGGRLVELPAAKFKGISAQMEVIERPTITEFVDVSPFKEISAWRARTTQGGRFGASVGTTQLKTGETFISRGVTKSIVERPGIDELLYGKSEVRAARGLLKPRATVLEKIRVKQAVGKKQLPIPESVSFSQFAEQQKPSRPFKALEQPSEPLKTEFVSPKLEKPEIRAIYEKPSKTGTIELTQREMKTLQEELYGELEAQRAAVGGEATKLNVLEYQKLGARGGWIAGGLTAARLIAGRTTVGRLAAKTQMTPLAAKTLLKEQFLSDIKFVPSVKTIGRITPAMAMRVTGLERTTQLERLSTLELTRGITDTVAPPVVPPFTPSPKWKFGLPYPPTPGFGGGRRGKRGSRMRVPEALYKPSVIALEFKIRGKRPKGLTGLEIRPIPF